MVVWVRDVYGWNGTVPCHYLGLLWAISNWKMQFTHVDSPPFFVRSFSQLRRPAGHQVLSGYHRHALGGNKIFKTRGVRIGYMLIEYIEKSKGKMLSLEWFTQQGDNNIRRTFFVMIPKSC